MREKHRRIIIVPNRKSCSVGSHEALQHELVYQIVEVEAGGEEKAVNASTYCAEHLADLLMSDPRLVADAVAQLFREPKPGLRQGQLYP